MKVVQCENKLHYYDAERYSSCPHCNTAAASAETKGNNAQNNQNGNDNTISKLHKLFSKKEKKLNVPEQKKEEAKSFAEPVKNAKAPQNVPQHNNHNQGVINPESQKKADPPHALDTDKKSINNSNAQEVKKPENIAKTPAASVASNDLISLQKAVAATNAKSIETDSKTIGFFSVESGAEPVVGWLVCVKGEYIGESFNLKSGRNNIGRALNMDIPLAKEPSVSRDRHAVLTFEPMKKKFILQAGESNGLTYLNDELVVMFGELKNYDVIRLGQAEFVFVGLCNGDFSWEKYI